MILKFEVEVESFIESEAHNQKRIDQITAVINRVFQLNFGSAYRVKFVKLKKKWGILK